MSYLIAFNNQISKFSKDLTHLFPEDSHLKLTHNAIFLLKVQAPDKLYKMFKKFLLKYRVLIINKDESFFLSNNYNDVVDDVHTNRIMNSLKTHWKEMTTSNRETCWNYFNILFKLHDLIQSKKNEN